jgi:D-sedoheptulose 7-phosphate isomerase
MMNNDHNYSGITDEIIRYINGLQLSLNVLPIDRIVEVITVLHNARLNSRQIFTMGNGGSASTASHFVCDLAKGTRKKDWPMFKVIGLSDNMAIFSAYGNDEGYENVFAQQLANFIQPHDVVIGISASGNSANVLNAITLANNSSATTIGFTGFDGGRLSSLVDINVHIPSDCIEQVEDIHLALEHMICYILRTGVTLDEFTVKKESIFEPEMGTSKSICISGREINKKKPLNDIPGQALYDSYIQIMRNIFPILEKSNEISELLPVILPLTLEWLDADRGSAILLNGQKEADRGILIIDNEVKTWKLADLSRVYKHGLVNWVINNGKPALVKNTLEDSRWIPSQSEELDIATHSAISVPIIIQNRWIGVVTLVRSQPRQFEFSDIDLLTAIIVSISMKVGNSRN